MKELLKQLLKDLLSTWNIYGGILISTAIAWYYDFSKSQMDTTTSFLVLTLTLVSVLTFLKVILFKSKPNGIDNVMLNQSSIKAMRTAVNPMYIGNEIGEVIVETKKVVKKGKQSKMINWIKKNKGFLTSLAIAILTAVGYVCSSVVDSFGAIVIYHGVNLIGVIGGLATVLVGLLTFPVTSTSLQEALDKAKQVYKENKVASNNAKKLTNKQTSELEERLYEEKANKLQCENTIKTYELLASRNGYNFSSDEVNAYNKAKAMLPQIEHNIELLEANIETLKN